MHYETLLREAGAARNPSKRLEGFPSWVPDWSLPPSELNTIFPKGKDLISHLGLQRLLHRLESHAPYSNFAEPNVLTVR